MSDYIGELKARLAALEACVIELLHAKDQGKFNCEYELDRLRALVEGKEES